MSYTREEYAEAIKAAKENIALTKSKMNAAKSAASCLEFLRLELPADLTATMDALTLDMAEAEQNIKKYKKALRLLDKLDALETVEGERGA